MKMINTNTAKIFDDKWHRNSGLAFENTLDPNSEIFKWIVERNGFNNAEGLRKFLSTKKRILDAGCGNGRVTALLRTYSDDEKTEVVGIHLIFLQNYSVTTNLVLKIMP
jgi:SAM-dependent methyltransferase